MFFVSVSICSLVNALIGYKRPDVWGGMGIRDENMLAGGEVFYHSCSALSFECMVLRGACSPWGFDVRHCLRRASCILCSLELLL